MRIALRLIVALLGLAVAAFFGLVPGLVESQLNPVLAPRPYRFTQRAAQLAKSAAFVDLHADSLLWGRDLARRSTRGQVDVPRLIEANVALQVFTIVTKSPRGLNVDSNSESAPDDITPLAVAQLWPVRSWGNLLERALFQARRFDEAVARSGGRLVPIRSRADLGVYLARREKDPQITAGLLGIEGSHALEAKVENLDRVFDAGVRLISPQHFFDNFAGGASAGERKGGLTAAGRELIRRMEDKHIVIDLAHSSAAVIDDVLALAKGPVICSHTGLRGVCNNNRNLTDAQARAIAKTGGVIGIAFFDSAICEVTVPSIVRSISHAVRVAGIDHVALGSDFDGSVATPFDVTGLPLLIDELLTAGFAEADIRKIAGENALRVLRQVLP